MQRNRKSPPSPRLRRDSLRSPLTRRAKTGGKGIRTPDFQLAKLALYQLSYAPARSPSRTGIRVGGTREIAISGEHASVPEAVEWASRLEAVQIGCENIFFHHVANCRSQNVDCAWPSETGIFASPCLDHSHLNLFSVFTSSLSSPVCGRRPRLSRNTARGDLIWPGRTQKRSRATISSVMPMEPGSTKLRSRRTSRPILCAWL